MGSTKLSRSKISVRLSLPPDETDYEDQLVIGDFLCQRDTDELLPIDYEEYQQSDEAYVEEVHQLRLTDEEALALYSAMGDCLREKGLLRETENG